MQVTYVLRGFRGAAKEMMSERMSLNRGKIIDSQLIPKDRPPIDLEPVEVAENGDKAA